VRSSKSAQLLKHETKNTTIGAHRKALSNNFTQALEKLRNNNSKAISSPKEKRSRRKRRDKLKQFGRNLRNLRLAQNLTREQLADKVKMLPSAISIYERGKRDITLREVYLLSSALDAQVARLFRGI
jgi:ribosome-binding protein aMBF1 (putative translation factor)